MSQVDEKETQVIDNKETSADSSIDATRKEEEQGEQTTHPLNSPVSSERVTRRDDEDDDDDDDDDMDDMDEDESSFKQQVTRGTKRNRDDADDEDTQEGGIDDEDASSELGDLTSKSKEVGTHFICLLLIALNKVHSSSLTRYTFYLSKRYLCESLELHSCWVDRRKNTDRFLQGNWVINFIISLKYTLHSCLSFCVSPLR